MPGGLGGEPGQNGLGAYPLEQSSDAVLHWSGLCPREHLETAGGLWSWQLGVEGRVLWVSSGQRPGWCSTPSKAQDSPAQGPVHSKTSRGSRLRNLGLEGNRLQWDHYESWVDVYIHTDIPALQVLWQKVQWTTEEPRHTWGEGGTGRGWRAALRKGQPCRMSSKGQWGGSWGQGRVLQQRISCAKKFCVRRYCGWFWKQRFWFFFFFFFLTPSSSYSPCRTRSTLGP